MNELIQAISDAVATGILGNAAYDVAKPIFQKFFPGKKVPMHDRQALLEWLKQELGNDEAQAAALRHELTTSIEAKIKGDGNIVVQGVTQSTVNIYQGGNAAPPETITPKHETVYLTPYAPIPDHERPLGRDEDLQELARRLQEAGQLVVVKGLGGIGKSTLARYYVDSHRHEYRHIAWVKVNSGLPAGFSQDTYLHSKLNLDLSQIPHEYDRFTACLNALEKLEGPNLLVLDNAVQDAAAQNYRSLLPKSPRWQVLLTSRHELNGYSKMELGKLSNDAARQLFERCYHKPVAGETWQELYTLTDGHALSLELFGKSLHKTLGRLGPEGLVQCLKEKKLDDPVLQQRIASGHSGDETTVYEHLLITFNLSEFGDYVIWLFKQFVALPLLSHRFDDLVALLQISEDDKDKLHNALLLIEETGWLQREGDGFLMHPMVQQAVYYHLHPTDKDIEDLVAYVADMIKIDEIKDDTVGKFPFVSFGDALLENVFWTNQEGKVVMQSRLGRIYLEMGKYKYAGELLQTAVKGGVKNFGKKHPNVTAIYGNLAQWYYTLGEFQKAREMFELVLESDIENFGEQHPYVATSRSNLASVYQELGDSQKACELLKLALDSDINNFGYGHPNVASAQNNLGRVYSETGNIDEARFLLEAALESDLKNFDEDHPRIAAYRVNLADVYGDIGENLKSLSLLNLALESSIKNYGETHSNIATIRSSLAIVHSALGNHYEALELIKLALESDIKNFGENHPNVASCFNNLASIYYEAGKRTHAVESFQKAIEIFTKTLGKSHTKTQNAILNLAYIQSQISKTTLPKSQLRKKHIKPRLKK